MEVIDERKTGMADKVRGSTVFKKLKGIKNIKLIAAVFIIAVALLIYSSVMVNRSADKSETAPAGASVMDEEERRLASILSGIEGAGQVETMISRQDDEIVGVLVIAEGADDIAVRLRLLAAATTAMGVDKQIVDVYTKK